MRPELVLAGDKADVDLVDEPVLALALELRLRLLRLVGADEVLLQSLVDDLEAGRVATGSSDAQYLPSRNSRTYTGTLAPTFT